jgi:dimethylargininase
MMFKNAIACSPCPAIVDGITSSNLGKPVYSIALDQHNKYVEILKQHGLKTEILPPRSMFPDSTFIEDVALLTSQCAIITRPGEASRQGETRGMKKVLSKYYASIEEIKYPATIEAGDIMMVGDHFYIGISCRTNAEGADQLIKILSKYGLTGSKVPLMKMLHLKSGISYLENNNMLVCGEFIENKNFESFNRIIVDVDESYAANSLWINNKVLVPEGFPKTKGRIEEAGYETIALNVSEFRKVDGGLSCLSLRF